MMGGFLPAVLQLAGLIHFPLLLQEYWTSLTAERALPAPFFFASERSGLTPTTGLG